MDVEIGARTKAGDSIGTVRAQYQLAIPEIVRQAQQAPTDLGVLDFTDIEWFFVQYYKANPITDKIILGDLEEEWYSQMEDSERTDYSQIDQEEATAEYNKVVLPKEEEYVQSDTDGNGGKVEWTDDDLEDLELPKDEELRTMDDDITTDMILKLGSGVTVLSPIPTNQVTITAVLKVRGNTKRAAFQSSGLYQQAIEDVVNQIKETDDTPTIDEYKWVIDLNDGKGTRDCKFTVLQDLHNVMEYGANLGGVGYPYNIYEVRVLVKTEDLLPKHIKNAINMVMEEVGVEVVATDVVKQ